MRTFTISLLVALVVSFSAFASPIPQAKQRTRPTELAHYKVGAYVSMDQTKLRVNVDKQLGGQVSVQLNDLKGNLLFERLMNQTDTTMRLNIDLTELADGDYQLKVSNGLEIIVRDLTISTPKTIPAVRTLTPL
ncbi:hypothetical protein G8759_28925 [Spirosoma aureum]|uniref:T9SS type A sorting domain-containing protein n=1 Tax=Spirosoma aureum TaxID=2692134 RepID=A0A6G9AVM3_9BACT|nr:hypothetical protein [Spirosoma aureum]QIP16379.1 hypothetical protein G8759_28925 [Spirosoma aureum]